MRNAPLMSLTDVAQLVQYGYTASASHTDIGPKFLRITDIVPPQIDWNEVPHCEIGEKHLTKFSLAQDDIVIARTGATVGYAKLIRDHEPSVFASYLVRVRVDPEKADPGYVGRIVESDVYRRFVLSRVGGSAQPNANAKVLSSFRLPIPERHIQTRIVAILSAYDDLIENNWRRITLLEEAARLLYREWFVHFRFPGHEHLKIIDGLPEGWERRAFDDVCKAIGGGTPKTSKPEYWSDANIPWYTPTDVTRNSCLALLDSATKITEAGLRGSSAKMLPRGTVLMTSRASVGFFGIIDTPSCTNQGFISILPHDAWARMHFLHNLMHRVEEIRSHAGGATYREISKGKFRVLPVVLPVESLLREFEDQASTLHAQVRSLHAMNQKLAQARDLLLPRLMNGEIAA